MSKLVLTADQIYALAYILKASYLDYHYISLASRDDNDKLWLSENTKQLVSQGILVEDFSGDTTIDPEVEALFKPVYFSTKESSLDISIFGEKEDNKGYRFHFLDDKITMTQTVDDGFEITEVGLEDIKKVISTILPSDYSANSAKADIVFDSEKITRLFVVKKTEVDVKNVINTFVETEGIIYEENTEDDIFSVSGSDFENKLYRILAEV